MRSFDTKVQQFGYKLSKQLLKLELDLMKGQPIWGRISIISCSVKNKNSMSLLN